jgi:hypothetical protein
MLVYDFEFEKERDVYIYIRRYVPISKCRFRLRSISTCHDFCMAPVAQHHATKLACTKSYDFKIYIYNASVVPSRLEHFFNIKKEYFCFHCCSFVFKTH